MPQLRSDRASRGLWGFPGSTPDLSSVPGRFSAAPFMVAAHLVTLCCTCVPSRVRHG